MKKKTIKNKEFIVIPEAKLVKGKMPQKVVFNDLTAGIKKKYKDVIFEAADNYYGDDEFWLRDFDPIEGKAYCDEKDEWDERIGIEVCAAKMDMKNHRKLARIYNNIAKDLQEAALIAQSYCIRHEDKAQAIEDDLVKYHGRLPL